MFEYLMPELLMPAYPDTLLHETVEAAVLTQIAYGTERGTPWDSESATTPSTRDRSTNHRAFGVPGLGFKRGLADDLVIAPYATLLALPVTPGDACRNLEAPAEKGYLGRYGFYEAIDYTPSRMMRTDEPAIVRAFMTHHHGMSLTALDNVLNDRAHGAPLHVGPGDARRRAAAPERVPRAGITMKPHSPEPGPRS